MLIALDYDKTYTADPGLWQRFVADAKARGHTVLCVTMRRYPSEAIEMPCPVVYTSRQAKAPFMAAQDTPVDVWVDDAPHWILADGG